MKLTKIKWLDTHVIVSNIKIYWCIMMYASVTLSYFIPPVWQNVFCCTPRFEALLIASLELFFPALRAALALGLTVWTLKNGTGVVLVIHTCYPYCYSVIHCLPVLVSTWMFRLHWERAPSCEALAALAGPASDVLQCIFMNSHTIHNANVYE